MDVINNRLTVLDHFEMRRRFAKNFCVLAMTMRKEAAWARYVEAMRLGANYDTVRVWDAQ